MITWWGCMHSWEQHGGGEGNVQPSMDALEIMPESINTSTLAYKYPIVGIWQILHR